MIEKNNLLIYKNKDGNIIVDAIYQDETLTDYNPKSESAYTFFKIVQNKLHWSHSCRINL